MAGSASGKAIPFITIDVDGDEENFVVNEEALVALRGISNPVAVVAIAGLYRTGKSFLVNRIVGRQKAFSVGPTIEACTKGIWLWSEPVKGTTLQGEDVSLIVLDTEGLGGTGASNHHDARVFALAVLLCSKLIYNSLGSIDEDAISNLSFVANLATMIRVNSNSAEEEEDVEELASFFPAFTWIVRDFALELLDEDGNEISPKEYLERSLEQNGGFDEAEAERNHVRACLTAFFRNRDCTTLVRPLEDEQKLQTVDKEDYDSLRPEFRKGMDEFRSRLLSSLPKKMVRGKTLNGPMLATLAKTYVHAMNNDGVPTISTAWEHVAENETRDALEKAIEMYETGMNDFLDATAPVAGVALFKKHGEMAKASLDYFERRAVGSALSKSSGIDKVSSANEKHFNEHIRVQNVSKSKALCESTIGSLIAEHVDNRLGVGDDRNALDSVEKVGTAFDRIRREYDAKAKGDLPGKAEILADAFFKHYSRAVKFVQDQVKKENDMLKEEIKSKEDERLKLVVDLKHEKTVHEMDRKEAAMEKKVQQQKLDQITLEFNSKLEEEQKQTKIEKSKVRSEMSEMESKTLKLQSELEKMELEIKRLQNLPKGGGCCVVM